MVLNRKPSLAEANLLEFLIKKSLIKFPSDWKDHLLVCSMKDDCMGSLYLFPNGIVQKNRVFGKQISECEFTDEDGIKVIVSLYIDDKGNLFELDIWKTDFSSLIKIPKDII